VSYIPDGPPPGSNIAIELYLLGVSLPAPPGSMIIIELDPPSGGTSLGFLTIEPQ
jgi:hypothetical protein